jgi:3,4-dihydroxy 2-butanone 4-phosphate synthase
VGFVDAMPALQATTDRVGQAIEALHRGQFVLLYDADGREEETDFVIPSETTTPDAVRRMRLDGGGLICTTLHPRVHGALDLPYLADVLLEAGRTNPLLGRLAQASVPYEPGSTKPSFTLSVNHRKTFTGVTDNDRSLTIRALAQVAAQAGRAADAELRDRFAAEFKAPGHVFLLNAHPTLLRGRRGHTELATALMELAGLAPSATICEMMNGPSGRALPKSGAIKYAAQNGLVFLEGREVLDAWMRATNDPST